MVVGRINGVVGEEMYGRFAGTQKSGRNNEVIVRRGSTVLQNESNACRQSHGVTLRLRETE